MFETQGCADATRVGRLHVREPPVDPRPRQTGNQHNIRSHEEFTHVLDHRRHGCPGSHRSAQRARRRQAPDDGQPPLSGFRLLRNSTQVRSPRGSADFLHTLTGRQHHSPTSLSANASRSGYIDTQDTTRPASVLGQAAVPVCDDGAWLRCPWAAAGPGRGTHGQRIGDVFQRAPRGPPALLRPTAPPACVTLIWVENVY